MIKNYVNEEMKGHFGLYTNFIIRCFNLPKKKTGPQIRAVTSSWRYTTVWLDKFDGKGNFRMWQYMVFPFGLGFLGLGLNLQKTKKNTNNLCQILVWFSISDYLFYNNVIQLPHSSILIETYTKQQGCRGIF
ncbi:hypothetical protein ACJX0J_038363, partial [Zea mays]